MRILWIEDSGFLEIFLECRVSLIREILEFPIKVEWDEMDEMLKLRMKEAKGTILTFPSELTF